MKTATFIIVGLWAFAAAQAQPTDTRTYNPWPGSTCGGVTAEYTPSHSVTFQIGSYTDTLPAGIVVQSVSVSWNFGNDRAYTYQPIPTVALYLNGQQLGPAQTIATSNLNCTNPTTYRFDSGFYSTGVPSYVTGGSNTLTMLLNDGGLYWSTGPIITVTYVVPPLIEFSVTPATAANDRRILISNLRTTFPYPGTQYHDGELFLFLRARDATLNYASGRTVYLRVIDPADEADYTNLPGNPLSHAIDNDGGAATLLGVAQVAGVFGTVYQGVSGSNGFLGFTLHLNNARSGDNYQIEASFDPTFAVSWKSPSLTAWKRIFVEKRQMLRNGIRVSAVAPAGADRIQVAGNRYGGNQRHARIRSGDRIILVHAPALDRSDGLYGWYSEEHDVLDVNPVSGTPDFIVELGARAGRTVTRQTLTNQFGPDPIDVFVSDTIARLSGPILSSADVFGAPSDDLVVGTVGTPSVFQQAFVDYNVLASFDAPGLTVPVSRVTTSDELLLQHLADKWNSTVTWNGTRGVPTPNHQLLIIGDTNGTSPPDAAGLTLTAIAGETASYVFRGAIEQTAHRSQVEAWAMKTEAHELAHQWQTDGAFGLADHCPSNTTVYNDATIYCLLAAADPSTSETQRANGIARFHLLQVGALWHSEYFGIRRRPDPFMP